MNEQEFPKITRTVIFIQFIAILILMGIIMAFDRKCDMKEQVNQLQTKQIVVQDQQINELQHQNIQMSMGFADAWGNPQQQVNIDTIRYASYANGYNDAIQHIQGHVDSGNGYTAGYHAGMFDAQRIKNNQPEPILPKGKNSE